MKDQQWTAKGTEGKAARGAKGFALRGKKQGEGQRANGEGTEERAKKERLKRWEAAEVGGRRETEGRVAGRSSEGSAGFDIEQWGG